MDILAGFLGHNIRIHRNFYRLPQETLQLANVSKILLAYDRGQIASKGRILMKYSLMIWWRWTMLKSQTLQKMTKMNVHNQKVSVIVSFALHFLDFYH